MDKLNKRNDDLDTKYLNSLRSLDTYEDEITERDYAAPKKRLRMTFCRAQNLEQTYLQNDILVRNNMRSLVNGLQRVSYYQTQRIGRDQIDTFDEEREEQVNEVCSSTNENMFCDTACSPIIIDGQHVDNTSNVSVKEAILISGRRPIVKAKKTLSKNCQYIHKKKGQCRQKARHDFDFCIRHISNDPTAPYRQCKFVRKVRGKNGSNLTCSNMIKSELPDEYCKTHSKKMNSEAPKEVMNWKASANIEGFVNSATVDGSSSSSIHDPNMSSLNWMRDLNEMPKQLPSIAHCVRNDGNMFQDGQLICDSQPHFSCQGNIIYDASMHSNERRSGLVLIEQDIPMEHMGWNMQPNIPNYADQCNKNAFTGVVQSQGPTSAPTNADYTLFANYAQPTEINRQPLLNATVYGCNSVKCNSLRNVNLPLSSVTVEQQPLQVSHQVPPQNIDTIHHMQNGGQYYMQNDCLIRNNSMQSYDQPNSFVSLVPAHISSNFISNRDRPSMTEIQHQIGMRQAPCNSSSSNMMNANETFHRGMPPEVVSADLTMRHPHLTAKLQQQPINPSCSEDNSYMQVPVKLVDSAPLNGRKRKIIRLYQKSQKKRTKSEMLFPRPVGKMYEIFEILTDVNSDLFPLGLEHSDDESSMLDWDGLEMNNFSDCANVVLDKPSCSGTQSTLENIKLYLIKKQIRLNQKDVNNSEKLQKIVSVATASFPRCASAAYYAQVYRNSLRKRWKRRCVYEAERCSNACLPFSNYCRQHIVICSAQKLYPILTAKECDQKLWRVPLMSPDECELDEAWRSHMDDDEMLSDKLASLDDDLNQDLYAEHSTENNQPLFGDCSENWNEFFEGLIENPDRFDSPQPGIREIISEDLIGSLTENGSGFNIMEYAKDEL